MTEDKARKTAARQRMAETGEPYSVARRAVEDEHVNSSDPLGAMAEDAGAAEAQLLSGAQPLSGTQPLSGAQPLSEEQAAHEARRLAEQAPDVGRTRGGGR